MKLPTFFSAIIANEVPLCIQGIFEICNSEHFLTVFIVFM
jgi:hypothetical protein